jgi:hypothetical protein
MENKKFTFLIDKGWKEGWRDRGGVSYAIKAFAEEFNKEDNIRMIVKINMSYGCDIKKSIEELHIENKNPAELLILPQQVQFKDLVNLYHESDVFVCTSLAEAFHLGCLQAQACRLPILTTMFGGQSDFCNENTGWLLEEGDMKEVKWDLQYEGISWKYPSIEEIRKKLRYIYEHQEEAKEKGLNALDNSKKWTWTNSAQRAKKALKEIKL